MLPKVRATALGLMRQGKLTITKKGKAVDPTNFRGVIRLRLPTEAETAAALAALPPDADEDDDAFATSTSDLEDVLADIRACRACLGELPHEPRPVVRVFPETRLLICGQAPGRRVHESGLPFTDPSGDRLRDWMGVDYETFYADHRHRRGGHGLLLSRAPLRRAATIRRRRAAPSCGGRGCWRPCPRWS